MNYQYKELVYREWFLLNLACLYLPLHQDLTLRETLHFQIQEYLPLNQTHAGIQNTIDKVMSILIDLGLN